MSLKLSRGNNKKDYSYSSSKNNNAKYRLMLNSSALSNKKQKMELNRDSRERRNLSKLSMNRIPSLNNSYTNSATKSTTVKVKSDLSLDLKRLNEKFEYNIEEFNQIVPKDASKKRPVGGKQYKDIKPRYKVALKNLKRIDLNRRTILTQGRNRRLRPTSACSSPTKMGNAYEDIESQESDRQYCKFIKLCNLY